MKNLEEKILEILKQGTPLKAVEIAKKLGVERKIVNQYLYSSLKSLVVQDSDYKWLLKSNEVTNTQTYQDKPPNQKVDTNSKQVKSDDFFTKQNDSFKQHNSGKQLHPTMRTVYSSTNEIKQDDLSVKQTSPVKVSQPANKINSYKIVTEAISGATLQEKVDILENAFAQEKFQELEDEQINALQSILEQSKHELDLANAAYTQGKLSTRKTNIVILVTICIAIAAGTFFATNQFQSDTNRQPNPTIQNQN